IVILGYLVNHTVDSGVVLVPMGFGKLKIVPRLVIQRSLPAEPENIWAFVGEDKHEIPMPPDKSSEYKVAVRITYANKDPDPEEDPIITMRSNVRPENRTEEASNKARKKLSQGEKE